MTLSHRILLHEQGGAAQQTGHSCTINIFPTKNSGDKNTDDETA
jgi:hypothetical protein